MPTKIKILFILYILVVIGLLLYSFTQVDLDLTLNRLESWQTVQKTFQQIGYFNRPLSTGLYLSIVFFLTLFYFLFLLLAKRHMVSKKTVWMLVLVIVGILLFSYNAFSYDLFNYVFDAKIVTYYHQNPYEHKALDYKADPMLSFMRWTHRTYPYGPTWLVVTVPLSYLGLHYFLPTLLLFKLLMAGGDLGTLYFIGKILRKVSLKNELFGLVFFGLNPLVIIESLVSAHIDIVMLFFAMWALYVFIEKTYVRSFFLLLFSIGIKFATVFLFPIVTIFFTIFRKKKDIQWRFLFITNALIMVVPVVLASIRTNFQPWYLLCVITFAALCANEYYIFIPAIIFSFIALFHYAPFLYLGNWDYPVPQILVQLQVTALCVSLVLISAYWIVAKKIPTLYEKIKINR